MIYNFSLEFTFTSERILELERQLTLLLTTPAGTMPLDREFGVELDFLDIPSETAKNLYVAEVTQKVAKFIPSVMVEEVRWTTSEDGILKPKVVITNA